MTRRVSPLAWLFGCACLLQGGAAFAATTQSLLLDTNQANKSLHWTVAEVSNGTVVTGRPVYGPTTFGGIPGLSIPFTDNDGYWAAVTSFTLPAGATNVTLVIDAASVDDRAVVFLNGQPLTAVGCCSKGLGSMTLRDGGPTTNLRFPFASGLENLTVTSGFVAGRNLLKVVVNNTGDGINGVPVPPTAFDPTNFGLTGVVTYTVPSP